ncbi:MAG TPA: VWA-like domain-containing protein [Rhizobium sp.]|nr:VWA-like domain-containing protein [Rhizobium sp.]
MALTAEQKILAARTALMWDHPFFGSLAVQLELIETDEIPTMATDGAHLYWNRKFVDGLKKPELVFVLAHEVLHNALDHHVRKGRREHEKWNCAADYAINGELVDCKVGKMPKCGLIDPNFTGRSAEEIYAFLHDQPKSSGRGGAGGNASDPGGCGAVIPAAAAHDHEALARASADMKVKVRQAAAIAAKAANGIGNLPGSMQRLIEKLLLPVVDWREQLRRFIDDSQSKDYSWLRPNRRHIASGFILPGLVSDGLNHLVVAVDTSGSIQDDALTRFGSEINGAFGDGSIDKITVIYADAAVARIEEFERGDELVLKAAGGGGTAFSSTFEWIAKNAPDASAIIYFTDLYVTDFGEQPAAPVMWAVYGDSRSFKDLSRKTPFGEAISLAA